MRKLGMNIGSGQRPFFSTPEIEWVNVDCVDRPNQKTDLICDGKRLTQANGVSDIVVMHHVLEHLWADDAAAMVREAYRVLRRSGSLIVCVPDMIALAEGWLDHKITNQVYMTNVYGAYMGDDADRHKWGYTVETLTETINQKQWYQVDYFDWRTIPGADIARDWWILAMEAIK